MAYSADTKTWKLLGGCDLVDALPPLGFVLGGTNFTLGPRQYIIQVRRAAHHVPAPYAPYQLPGVPCTTGVHG